jgi:hypothetical protein
MEVADGSDPYDSCFFDVPVVHHFAISPGHGLSAETRQIMAAQGFREKVPIDRLSGRGSLSRRDDQLAVSRSHTAGRIQTGDSGPHIRIDDQLPFLVFRRSESFG